MKRLKNDQKWPKIAKNNQLLIFKVIFYLKNYRINFENKNTSINDFLTTCETLYFLNIDLIFVDSYAMHVKKSPIKNLVDQIRFFSKKSVFCYLCKLQKWGHPNIHIQLNYYNYYSKLCILPMLHHHYIVQCSDELHFSALHCVDTLDDLTENHISVTVNVTAIYLQQEQLTISTCTDLYDQISPVVWFKINMVMIAVKVCKIVELIQQIEVAFTNLNF